MGKHWNKLCLHLCQPSVQTCFVRWNRVLNSISNEWNMTKNIRIIYGRVTVLCVCFCIARNQNRYFGFRPISFRTIRIKNDSDYLIYMHIRIKQLPSRIIVQPLLLETLPVFFHLNRVLNLKSEVLWFLRRKFNTFKN